jgi:hypothetical protein
MPSRDWSIEPLRLNVCRQQAELQCVICGTDAVDLMRGMHPPRLAACLVASRRTRPRPRGARAVSGG